MTVKQALNLIFSGTITLVATLLIPNKVQAVIISDPAGDFLPTYTGTKGGDLDVITAEVSLNGSQLFFSATLAATVGTTPGALYVFGLDRGQGTQRFVAATPSVGTGVFFDSVIILNPNGTAQFTDNLNTANSLPNLGLSSISGNRISGTFNISQFPSTGFAPSAYTWNLWPRLSTIAGTPGISDFAPNAANASVLAVPEPSNISGLLAAAGCLVFLKSRKSKRKLVEVLNSIDD
jgi:hypothetical protein